MLQVKSKTLAPIHQGKRCHSRTDSLHSASNDFLPESRRSRRMIIAHRFIGGIGYADDLKSVKRTADRVATAPGTDTAVRFTDCENSVLLPSAKALGYF